MASFSHLEPAARAHSVPRAGALACTENQAALYTLPHVCLPITLDAAYSIGATLHPPSTPPGFSSSVSCR